MHLLEDIDISIEYTGTAFVNIMGKKAISDSDETYKQAKEFFESNYELTWLKPLGFNNTYTLTVTKETTEIIVVSFVYFVIFIN